MTPQRSFLFVFLPQYSRPKYLEVVRNKSSECASRDFERTWKSVTSSRARVDNVGAKAACCRQRMRDNEWTVADNQDNVANPRE